MEESSITFTLNGVLTIVETHPTRPLVDVLREDLDLTGTKRGCDYEGQCGACTVVVDERAVRSCRTPVGRVAGKRVTTIEGLAVGGQLHPLQQAFIDCGAVQCGYCTPGMILSAKALLDRNPHPSREEVKRALSGNLCRCTGYVKIVDAVMRAAAVMRGETPPVIFDAEGVLGRDPRRLEAIGKTTGEVRYVEDLKMPGMLYARVLRSPHAHARIAALDATAALALEGVEAVITAADIPGVKAFTDTWTWERGDQPFEGHPSQAYEPVLAAERVRMVGDPVAIVVARRDAVARAALDAVQVSYEPWAPVLDPAEALDPDAPPLHETGNLYERHAIKTGDFEAAQSEAPVELTTRYASPARDHVPLERDCALSYVDEDGRVVVVGPTHEPHVRRHQIARMLDVAPEAVRVIVPPMGGSFGDRHHHWLVVTAALPAYVLRRPVRITYTRAEVFESTWKQHPFRFHLRVGADREGRLTGLWARGLGDAGPYGGAWGVAEKAAICGTGPYVWRAVDYAVRVAHTNNANAGSIRGYGMPESVFAVEGALDELARALEMDPWALRARNAAVHHAASGQKFDEVFCFKEVLEAVRPTWEVMRADVRASQAEPHTSERRGVGLAANWYLWGKPTGELRSYARAALGLDGRITLYYCVQNSGQGLNTVMSQFAAEVLGVSREAIALVNSDTDLVPDSHIYGVCRSAYWVGGAMIEAAQALKRAILGVAAEMLDASPERLVLEDRGVMVQGGASRRVSFVDVAAEFERCGVSRSYLGVFDLENRFPREERLSYLGHFSAGVALTDLVVNVETGRVAVQRIVLAQDVGRVLNPLDFCGQMEGAAMMELGVALMEEHVPSQTLSFRRYPMPRARDLPEIVVIPVEVAGRDGPYGAKGIGEMGTGHVRAAIVNAIYDATGARMRHLPATPQRILDALRQLDGEDGYDGVL